MTQTEQFFYDNAGFSYDPKKETEAEGKLRCAQALAEAEDYGKRHGFVFQWEADQDGCIGCECGSEDCHCCTGEAHEVLCCVLRDEDGTVLASLGAICEPTREYGRVIEAELALEGMPLHDAPTEAEELTLA